jgi:hypothetical protein
VKLAAPKVATRYDFRGGVLYAAERLDTVVRAGDRERSTVKGMCSALLCRRWPVPHHGVASPTELDVHRPR